MPSYIQPIRAPKILLMPHVEARGEWERLKKAQGRDPQSLPPPLAFCKSCTIGISPLYVQRELYLLPVPRLRKRRATIVGWNRLCSYCAVEALDAYGLSFGYCLLAEHDYSKHVALDTETLIAIEEAKIAQLSTYLAAHWPEEVANDQEQLALALARLSPPVATLSQLSTTLSRAA